VALPPPVAPTNLAAVVQGGGPPSANAVTLSWFASLTSSVVGYNVYRSVVSGSGFVRLNPSLVTVLTFTDTTVQSGTTYYYVVTAVGPTGVESGFSNQAAAVIP